MRSGRWFAVVAVVAALVSACSGGSSVEVRDAESTEADGASTDSSQGGSAESVDTSGESSAGDPIDGEVVLLDPGQEPRRVLVHQWTAGQTERASTVVTQSFRQWIDGEDMGATNVPAVEAVSEMTITEVDEGTAVVRSEVIEMSSTGPASAETDDLFESFVGTVTSMRISPSGAISESSTESDAEVAGMDLAQFTDAAGNSTVPFPDEPVGVGAQWTATAQIPVLGVLVEQTMTYRVVELTDTEVVMSITVQQAKPEGDLEIPGMPGGAIVEVREWDISGSGRTTVTFGRTSPALSLEIAGSQVMVITIDGVSAEVVQDINTVTVVTPG